MNDPASDYQKKETKMRIGIAADHGGYELKEYLALQLKAGGCHITDFGAFEMAPDDDYPDYVIPLARAVAAGEIEKGLAICGSGVGACVVANKIPGVRAALITDIFSAHQGVEDDRMNIMCLGGRVTGRALALDLVWPFLNAKFKTIDRFIRRLDKIAALEKEGGRKMKQNPLLGLQEFGQSVWQDDIHRKMIETGELKRRIDQDGIRGVTSNPSIFDKAIGGGSDYDTAISALAHKGKRVEEIYETLTVEDIQNAADEFRQLYDVSDGKYGFVSLEVNPHLAHDAEKTIEEARRLWAALDRPNVFIKVPATEEGLAAIRRLIHEGINVNVTLLFGLPRYREVAEAYIAGLEARAADGLPLERVASVASFFLSRIDVLVDPMLEKIMNTDGPEAQAAKELHGLVAIASARRAYQIYKETFSGEGFEKLAAKGARTQRVLWASTSSKNPAYSDVKYVEALIGPKTINTLPRETMDAYRDHGDPAARLEAHPETAGKILAGLSELNIDIDAVTRQLEDEGLEKFNKPYDSLMNTIREKGGDVHNMREGEMNDGRSEM